MEMSIGELAQRSGLASSTIRYYEEMGLLPQAPRAGGRRMYADEPLDRLLVIAFAKEAGFSLREIRQLFDGFSSNAAASARWRKLRLRRPGRVRKALPRELRPPRNRATALTPPRACAGSAPG